jgi:hypothetical protein
MRYYIFSKRNFVTFVVLALLGLVTPSSALTLSFPELAGGLEIGPFVEPDFSYPGMREFDFVIPENVTSIEDMVFVLSGNWHTGEITCSDSFGGHTVSPFLPPISIFITSDAFPGDYFHSSISMVEGSFESLTGEFTSSYPPGVLEFNDLLGADLHAELFIDWGLILICSFTIDSYGILDQVELQLTGTVPTEGSSWGEIKSLYR